MGAIRTLADSAYADGPASAPQQPPKNTIRELFGLVDEAVAPVPGLVSDVADLKEDVDALVTGVKWKDPVRTVALVNTSVSSGLENGDVVNGVTLATGDRVLLVNQSSAATNGVYVVVASGAASRATDVDTGAEILASGFFVEEGTDDAGTSYFLNTAGPITLGSTALTFVKVSGLGYGIASDETAKEGTAIDELMTPSNTKAVFDERLSGLTGAVKADGVRFDFMSGVLELRNGTSLTGGIVNLPGSDVAFSRSTVKTVTGPDGLQKNYAADELAYEFDLRTRKPLGLRIEDAVTNLLIRTLAPGSGWSIGGATATGNAADNADGTTTATEFVLSGSSSHHARNLDIAVVNGTKYVFEALLKRVAGTGSIWIINTLDDDEGVRFFWNADGTLTATVSHGSPHTYGWDYAGDDFYRLWVGLTAGPGGLITINTYFADATGNNVHANSGTWHHGGAWFYEGEGLRNAPDTTGSSAASVRDIMTIDPADVFPRLGPSGTIEMAVGPWVERAASNHVFLDLQNAGGNERIFIRNAALGLSQVVVQVMDAAGTQVNLTCGTGKEEGFRVTVTWSPDGVKVYDSGIEAASDAIVLNMAAADTCYIGPNGSGATTNALFRSLEYWPYERTAADIGGASEGTGSYRLAVVDGNQVIVDGLDNIISPTDSNVYSLVAETIARLGYSSDMYNGQVLPYRQIVPGTTPVLKGARNRLLMSAAAGQSLSVSSTTYDSGGTVLLSDPQHPPVVLSFPYGPQGFNNVVAEAGDVDELVPAESVYRDSGSATVGDTHNLACAYAMQDRFRGSPWLLEPRFVTGWGVGDQTVTDLAEGGASNSWVNFETILAAFVARSAELDMEPVVDWLQWNQGEANQNTARATYVSQVTTLFDAYKGDIEAETSQSTGDLRFIIQQLGSRKTSSLPSGVCEVPLAQEELSEGYGDCYVVPTYWVQHNYAADQSHLDYEGFILVGEITARAQAWVDEWNNRDRLPTILEGDWVGCKLLSWERVGTAVTLTFNVPFKHLGHRLAIDTTSLPAFPKYGIEFTDDGTPISITGDPVLHADGDKITLTLGSAPSGTEKVRIGYTNTTADGLGFVRPGTNIRTTWSKPSRFIAGVMLYDWCQMGEKAAT